MPTSSEPPRAVVVLVPDEDAMAAMQPRAETATRNAGTTVLLEVARGSPRDAIARARQVHGNVPLAFIGAAERDVVDALADSADYAVLRNAFDVPWFPFEAFVRRTIVRARARVLQERLQANVANTEKLAALGTVIAGVAHEINNPTAAVLLSMETLRLALAPLTEVAAELQRLADEGRGATAGEIAELAEKAFADGAPEDAMASIDEALSAVDVITHIVRDLRIFARSNEDEEPVVVEIPDLLDQVLRIAGGALKGIAHVERDYPPDLPRLYLPRSRLVQVLTNILVNAAQAMQEIERPVHRVRVSARADEDGVVISVHDTGPGIPPERLERIFDPFYTTKAPGIGTGLGLSLSRELTRRMGGELIAQSEMGEGATFLVYLPPLEPKTRERVSAAPPSMTTPRKRHAVLVVDDDERLLRTYARVLRERFDVLLASDGQEAIDMLRSGSRADAIVTDLAMPEVDGARLVGMLRDEFPALAARTVVVTAGARSPEDEAFLRDGQRPVLMKPVAREILIRALDEVLSR